MARRPIKPPTRSQKQYTLIHNAPAQQLARAAAEAVGAPYPKFIEPQLATLRERPASGDGWVHEIKYDGYRFQLHVREGHPPRFFTRRGHDWSPQLRALATAASGLPTHAAVLDGEVIVPTPEGRSDFHALEKALSTEGGSPHLVMYVFDILYLDGLDLRAVPLIRRKEILSEFMNGAKEPLRSSEHLEAPGSAWR